MDDVRDTRVSENWGSHAEAEPWAVQAHELITEIREALSRAERGREFRTGSPPDAFRRGLMNLQWQMPAGPDPRLPRPCSGPCNASLSPEDWQRALVEIAEHWQATNALIQAEGSGNLRRAADKVSARLRALPEFYRDVEAYRRRRSGRPAPKAEDGAPARAVLGPALEQTR